MARFVEDLALALPVISGVDWRDSSVIDMPLGDPAAMELPGLRAAFYTDDGIACPAPETIETVRAAARALSEAGLIVEETRPRRIEETYDITLKYWRRRQMTGVEVDDSLFEWDRFRRALPLHGELRRHPLPGLERPAPPHAAPGGPRGISYTLTYSLTGWPCVECARARRRRATHRRTGRGASLAGGLAWRSPSIEAALGGFHSPLV
jgi:amidase